ncbi:hypothetical protein BSKO_10258 [Bryopsis sp. KO-2023]|nr:hypothetical protein BSKO_10258 [Bryopsis sp. KO-2023]
MYRRRVWSSVIGDYDYKYLCKPSFLRGKNDPKSSVFFPVDEPLALIVALVMGLQHSLCMTAGIITVPLILGLKTEDVHVKQYMISSALIVSGITTVLQVSQIKISKRYALGTGIISAMGSSFTFLPAAQSAITLQMADGATFKEAFGKVLGTVLLCSWVEIALSFLPAKLMQKAFPPLITGVTITLLGVSLTGTGMQSWGGGVACAESPSQLCGGNGDVALPFGSAEYIGLGLVVLLALVAIEMLGSPFMKNTGITIALLVAYCVAAAVNKDGKSYVSSKKMEDAPWITFLWVETFPLGFFPPAVIPLMIAFVVTSLETIGDIGASEVASRLEPSGPEHEMRVRGGLLMDGLAGVFGALGTSMPTTIFSMNNSVISVTRTASRSVGYACGFLLVLFGTFRKMGAFITTIPDCIFGGVLTFLFANIVTAGIKMITWEKFNRRNGFILAASLGLGIGVSVNPGFFDANLWPITSSMSHLTKGLRDAVILTLSTGYAVGGLTAMLLNLVLPLEEEDDIEGEESQPFIAV